MNSIKILILLILISFSAQAQNPEMESDISDITSDKTDDKTSDDSRASVPGPTSAPPLAIKSGKGGAPPPRSGPMSIAELENKVKSRVKDPFMLPNHLYLTVKKKQGEVEGDGYVDESIEPTKRWALKYYHLIAIIWNVKKPKAMITDRNKTHHIFYIGDRIGNNEGVITSIGNGQVKVTEKSAEVILKMSNVDK